MEEGIGMRLLTLLKDEKQIICVLDKTGEKCIDIATVGLGSLYSNMNELILNGADKDFAILREISQKESASGLDFANATILSPIPRPVHDIICLGMNYSEHAAEFGRETPDVPVFFSKRAAMTSGYNGKIDGHLDVDEQFDYEVELAVIIGSKCSKIAESEVESRIFGYTVFNDFSSRRLQNLHKQWFLGKSGDTCASMGPWIVTKDELPMPFEVNLCSRVNGEIRQSSNTGLLVHSIPKVIALLSQTITLEAGDIIATGTPSGVGMGYKPPRFLKSGDVVECEIERVGLLRNTIS